MQRKQKYLYKNQKTLFIVGRRTKTPSPLEDTQTQEETSQAPENTQDVSTPSEAEDSKPPQNTQDNTEQSKTLNNTKPKTILFDNNGGEGTTPESITLANGDVFVFLKK